MPHRPIDGLAISPEKGAETIIYLASSSIRTFLVHHGQSEDSRDKSVNARFTTEGQRRQRLAHRSIARGV